MHCCRTKPGLLFPRGEVQPSPAMLSCSPCTFISVMMHSQLPQACTAQQGGLGEQAPQEDPVAWHCSVLSSTSPLLGQQRAEPTFSTAMRHWYLLLNLLAVRQFLQVALICCPNLKLCFPLILFFLSQFKNCNPECDAPLYLDSRYSGKQLPLLSRTAMKLVGFSVS